MTLETSINGLNGIELIYPEAAKQPLGSDDAIHLFVGNILEKNFVFARGISRSRMLQAESSANLTEAITQLALNYRVVVHVASEKQARIRKTKANLMQLSVWDKIRHNLTIRLELAGLLGEVEGIQLYSTIPPGPNVMIHVFVGQLRGKNLEFSKEIPNEQIVRIKSSTWYNTLVGVLQDLTTHWSVEVHVDHAKEFKLRRALAMMKTKTNLTLPKNWK